MTNNGSASVTPAFILSLERSGSTLLRYIVDTHPDIAVPGHIDLGQLCEMLHKALTRTMGQVSGITDAVERERLVLGEVRRILGGLMERYAAAKHKRMWCEKTATNLDHVDMIKAVFPDAKYVCLYRNAMDVVHSCIEAGRLGFMAKHIKYVHESPENIVAAMVHSWVDNTRMLLRFEQENRAQCFRLTYESYVLHPEAVLPSMFAFLGVPWDASLLDAVFSTQHDPGGGDSKIRFAQRIHHDSIGKGSTLNRQLIPERLLEEMNAVLTELSYPIVGPDWDTTPSPYRTMMAPSMTADPVTPEISAIFSRYLTQRISAAQVGFDGRQITYKVVVTGDAGGVWMITPTASETQVRAGEEPADCTFTLAGPDLLALINGTLNPAEAWMQGKLHIAGDLAQAEAFGRILFGGRHNTPSIELQQV